MFKSKLITGPHFDSQKRKGLTLPDAVRASGRKLPVSRDLPWPI